MGRTATPAEVRWLLNAGAWRPVVMGAWFGLQFSRTQVGADLLRALGRSAGGLTAPPLAVAASLQLGRDALPALVGYVERDLAGDLGSAGFVAAVAEDLGGRAAVRPGNRDRPALAGMLRTARRLEAALLGV